jgi:2-dehydro-3-deoxy-D-arabinonate dehydratase
MKIRRNNSTVFEGTTNTSQMRRSILELLGFLKKDNVLARFTLLMTGTSIVPPDNFTLQQDDYLEIDIENIGTLKNPVRKLS